MEQARRSCRTSSRRSSPRRGTRPRHERGGRRSRNLERLVSGAGRRGRPFRTRCVRRQRHESSPSASGGRRRRASCARTTTRLRMRLPTHRQARPRFRCSLSPRSSTAASITWRRSVPRSTCRSFARTSSSPSISSLEAVAFGADAVLLIVGALERWRASPRCGGRARRSDWRRWSKCTTLGAPRAFERERTSSASTVATCGRLTVDGSVLEQVVKALFRRGQRLSRRVASNARRHRPPLGAGYCAFLVGERLIAEPDPGAALRALRTGVRPGSDRGQTATDGAGT